MSKVLIIAGKKVPAKIAQHLTQYKQMCHEITKCDAFDECKDIIDKSVAMAAYYAQIKDIKTEVMFYRIRLRAWRRIGELFSAVDLSDCENPTQKARKIRAAFKGDPTVVEMRDSRIIDVVKIMAVSDKDFEYAVQQQVNGSIIDLLRRTPAGEKDMEEQRKRMAKWNAEAQKRQAIEQEKNRKAVQERLKFAETESKHHRELDAAAQEAMKEVGITLERKDRARIKPVVFLIKEEVHATMRQAAFDKRITMQEVLRRGLKLWLEANGYDWPGDDNTVKSSRSIEDRLDTQ
jgi:hypothetical protein